jgi:hypothetical protein
MKLCLIGQEEFEDPKGINTTQKTKKMCETDPLNIDK